MRGIENELQLHHTRAKIQRLEARYEAAANRLVSPGGDLVRGDVLRSLRETIDEFTEECIDYEHRCREMAKLPRRYVDALAATESARPSSALESVGPSAG
jgi:hypothetical protein